MTQVESFPCEITEMRHVEIPMADGCKLAARIWMPSDAHAVPVPAILEYIPYRKNDFTAERDMTMQPYRAGHGYAAVRLDLRGAGDSEGVMEDEYTEQELQDGCEAIAWIAAQDWCDGNVGMIGISWGGFNGLQIAARQPPALKSVITLCSTDDRYADDVHYMGGCLLGEQISWASIMFGRNTLAPDPENVGDRWRELWHGRLRGSGLWLKTWTAHQRRDDYWKHGSICEDWSAVKVPVWAISGWADGYCRSVFRIVENLQAPAKGLIGPWAHRYPHVGEPGPAIGFLQEELRWWDHWLKGQSTGIMEEPRLQLFMQDSAPPRGHHLERPGRWIAEPAWPSPNVTRTPFHLGADGSLDTQPGRAPGPCTHRSPLWVGMASGKWCGYATAGDSPVDQRREDAGSLCFDTAPLEAPLEMAGDANVKLRVSVDRPVAQLAARMCDVAPDGASTRVSFGVFNLTHRNGHETPEPLEPGRVYDVTIPMKHVAQHFPAGHKLRLALSTSYFPMIWPAPEPVTVTVHAEGSHLELPVRDAAPEDSAIGGFQDVRHATPMRTEPQEPPDRWFEIVEDAATGRAEMRVANGQGKVYHPDTGITVQEQGYERYTIAGDDPTSAEAETRWIYGVARADWHAWSETWTRMTADETDFHIQARLKAWEGDDLVEEIDWHESVPRDLT
ncbi:CocE/NonD family hydrolase [Roseovarius salinarum]|uniref:CocE/NonD family hydrolase n=1 Tax=Roseovarius salinarum TaxID=1981892 RepID=UPI000C33288F|nr:CocE/NonD family hydrolase [Roseovarius salinarum]